MRRLLLALGVLLALGLIVATALALLAKRRERERRAQTLRALHELADRVAARGATTDDYPPRGDDPGTDVMIAAFDMDGWGRALRYSRPGPLHTDGWDVYSLGPDGTGKDLALYVGDRYVPPARSERVEALYDKETRERLGELHALVAKLAKKPESQELKDLLAALRAANLIDARGRARFMDLFGHHLRWACPGHVHAKGWDLYSMGPDGVDDQGAGDDIVTGEDAR